MSRPDGKKESKSQEEFVIDQTFKDEWITEIETRISKFKELLSSAPKLYSDQSIEISKLKELLQTKIKKVL